MHFTLKDYQADAVSDVLVNLRKGRRYWSSEGDPTAFSLTATTGAGKTVMAAAVFETLFYGDDSFDFEGDSGAVVVWFSDDPTLNEQTRFRIMEASDRLSHSDLVVVQNTFVAEKFAPRRIYFLNTQKLGKNSLLVRGHDAESDRASLGEPMFDMRPDTRAHTIWDTVRNTIEDSSLTLYLVLDEAHRGMSSSKALEAEKSSVVLRLINGHGDVPRMPVVWGISATVQRFDEAMKGATGRTTLPNVVVESRKVQESGLLKDTIVLEIPDELGAFETVLRRRATDKIRASTEAWDAYAREQEEREVVVPLMVLQVPNKPDREDIGRAIDTIREAWPALGHDGIAHVFGDHTEQRFGSWAVPYVSPERVQDARHVKVLIAKDAISTGWDCPRAEVMISFRPANDRTHITQLLGRMVRSPLARRIPGNERLNSVECLLPYFNRKTVTAVADELMYGPSGEADPLPGRRVMFEPVEAVPNVEIPDVVWERFCSLPSQSIPRKRSKPVKRLTALAQELVFDGLLEGAGGKAHAELHKTLDGARARFTDEIAAASNAVMTMEGQSLVADLGSRLRSFSQFVEEVDVAVIEDAYRRAARILSPDLARTYAESLAARDTEAASTVDALLRAHATIAALGLVDDVRTYLEADAERTANSWLDQYRVQIKTLSDERQEIYREIKEMSTDPVSVDLVKPASRFEPSMLRDASGDERPLPTRTRHLLSRTDGAIPIDLNPWEIDVLDAEIGRASFVAWYRNPGRASQDSLAVAYRDQASWRALRPDFLFFNTQADGSIAASIVDPHSYHLSDALPKLKGLAAYAQTYGESYARVESVAKVGDTLRVLDLTSASVRSAVSSAPDATSLYSGRSARDYL